MDSWTELLLLACACWVPIIALAILTPVFALFVWSSWEMIWEGKNWKDTLGYFAYKERFGGLDNG